MYATGEVGERCLYFHQSTTSAAGTDGGRYVNGEAESKPPNFCLFFLLLIKRKYNTYTTSVRYKGKNSNSVLRTALF